MLKQIAGRFVLVLALMPWPIEADPKSENNGQQNVDRDKGTERALESGKGHKYGLYKHGSKAKKKGKDSSPKSGETSKSSTPAVDSSVPSDDQSGSSVALIETATPTASVPEPSTLLLMLSGLAVFLYRWNKRQ